MNIDEALPECLREASSLARQGQLDLHRLRFCAIARAARESYHPIRAAGMTTTAVLTQKTSRSVPVAKPAISSGISSDRISAQLAVQVRLCAGDALRAAGDRLRLFVFTGLLVLPIPASSASFIKKIP